MGSDDNQWRTLSRESGTDKATGKETVFHSMVVTLFSHEGKISFQGRPRILPRQMYHHGGRYRVLEGDGYGRDGIWN